ncbi:hypothetical protein BAC2_01445 [uncultured bacterium]|nr:hypothetical protein BAC2_01445 [uncultured bacterium]
MAVNFETLVNEALQLSLEDQARLVTRIVTAMSHQHDEMPLEDIEPFTDEEIAEMLRPEPMTGAEIVAAGLTGGWADLGIADGAEWVQEQRFSRRWSIFTRG